MKTNYLQFPVIRELSAKTLKKSFKKRDKFIKDLKDPKFRAKAKIKDYKGVLYWHHQNRRTQRYTQGSKPKPNVNLRYILQHMRTHG